MIRQLKQSRVLRELWPGEMRLAYVAHGQEATPPRWPQAASAAATQLPRRPDASALSEAIPLFYIGRNKNGLWVAREAEGRCGGLFLFKQSAARFARRQSEPDGCAMMFLAEPFELDVENQGSRFAGLLAAASESCGAPRAASCELHRIGHRGMAEAHHADFGRFRRPSPASRRDRKGAVPRPVYAVLEERRRLADPVIRHSRGASLPKFIGREA